MALPRSRAAIVEWTGNGGTTQIVPCPFTPAVVIECTPGNQGGIWRSAQMDADEAATPNTAPDAARLDDGALQGGTILSLSPTNAFTVGTVLNQLGTDYMAMAFSAGDGLAQGSYVGAGGPRVIPTPWPPQFQYVAHYQEPIELTRQWTARSVTDEAAFAVARPSARVESLDGNTIFIPPAAAGLGFPGTTDPFQGLPELGDYRLTVNTQGTITLLRGVGWAGDLPVVEWDTLADFLGLIVPGPPVAAFAGDGITPVLIIGVGFEPPNDDTPVIRFQYVSTGGSLIPTVNRIKNRTLPPIIRLIYEADQTVTFRSTDPLVIVNAAGQIVTSRFTVTADMARDGFGNVIAAPGFSLVEFDGGPGEDRPDVRVFGGLPASVNVITVSALPVYRTRSLTLPPNASRYFHSANTTDGLLLQAAGFGVEQVQFNGFTVSAEQALPGERYYWFALRPRRGFLTIIPYTGANGWLPWNVETPLVMLSQSVTVYAQTTDAIFADALVEGRDYQILGDTPVTGQQTLINRGLWSLNSGGDTSTPAVMSRAAVTQVTTLDGLTVYELDVDYSEDVTLGITTLTNLGTLDPTDVLIYGTIGGGTQVGTPGTGGEELAGIAAVALDTASRTVEGAGQIPVIAWTVPAPAPQSQLDTNPLASGGKSVGLQIFWRSPESGDCRGLADGRQDTQGITALSSDGMTLGTSRNVNAVDGLYDAYFFLTPDTTPPCGHPTANDPCAQEEEP